jgi:hypothetical protein
MKPFNLQEALAGKPVVTRDGRDVSQITLFTHVDTWCVVAVVENFDTVSLYTQNGRYTMFEDRPLDLFMKSTKHQRFVNVWPDPYGIQPTNDGEVGLGNFLWNSQEEADTAANDYTRQTGIKRLTTAVVEWED